MIIRPKYLGDYKGELCVIDEDSFSNEPKMLVLYWPTGIMTDDFLASYGSDMMGRQVRPGRFGGSYIIDGTMLQINLTEGGQDPTHPQQDYPDSCPESPGRASRCGIPMAGGRST